MARFWREQLDPNVHVDFMSTSHIGGVAPELPSDPLIPAWAYFVEVCGFTFQFVSIEQLQRCLSFFRERTHPSSIQPGVELEHYWQRWYERLPQSLFKESKRIRVVAALEMALKEFQSA